jgi:hypothetical protein
MKTYYFHSCTCARACVRASRYSCYALFLRNGGRYLNETCLLLISVTWKTKLMMHVYHGHETQSSYVFDICDMKRKILLMMHVFLKRLNPSPPSPLKGRLLTRNRLRHAGCVGEESQKLTSTESWPQINGTTTLLHLFSRLLDNRLFSETITVF